MSDEDEVILGCPADSSSEASGDAVLSAGSPEIDPAGSAKRRRVCRQRDAPERGSFSAWLACNSALLATRRAGDEDRLSSPPARKCVAGLCTVTWSYKPNDAASRAVHQDLMPRCGYAREFAAAPLGFLQYEVDRVWFLRDAAALPVDIDLSSPSSPLRIHRIAADEVLADGESVRSFLGRWDDRAVATLVVTPAVLEKLHFGMLPCAASSCKLTSKTTWKGRVPNYPPAREITKWTANLRRAADAPDVTADMDVEEEILLELPKHLRAPQLLEDETAASRRRKAGVPGSDDPIKLLNACGFATFLRSCADFTVAMNASHRYDRGVVSETTRDDKDDPDGSTILKAKSKFDVVDCLMWRRQFAADRKLDRILHITLNSDSSPTTGQEIQGQVVDIVYRDKSHRNIVLPGASLCYGHLDAMNKTTGLLHAVWLIAGPDLPAMSYFISKVRCICTDMGVEMHILDSPDILQALLAWMSGKELVTCAALVRTDRRLYWMALRISGWSHSMGNLLKTILNRCERWPAFF